MTKALVLLAATLVAASLGVVAQENSTEQSSSPALQSSRDSKAPSQATSNTQTDTANPSSSQAAAANDSAQVPATSGTAKGVEYPAPGEDPGIAKNNVQLPQTSTFLPLLGLIGLGSLIAGLFARR
jgi:hypothetical protein